MSTIVRCKGCGKQLRLSERMAGRRVACPACRTTISVPQTCSSPNSDNPASPAAGSSPAASAGQSQSPTGPSQKKPLRSPSGPRDRPAPPADDPFDLAAHETAARADPSGVDPSGASQAAEAPLAAVSISSGPKGTSSTSRTARRGRGEKKSPSQKLILQCGIGFGVFLVLAMAILVFSRSDDHADSLKRLVYKQFYDCEDQKLLKKLVEKHHRHCVDASTNQDKQVDPDKYEEMMRLRVGKDLFDRGIKGYWSG